jgi:hypothetical protein
VKLNQLKLSFATVESVNTDDTLKVVFQYPSTAVSSVPDPGLSLDCPALVTSAHSGAYQAGDLVAVMSNNANSVLLVLGVVQGDNEDIPL